MIEPLFWLGMVDLGADSPDAEPAAFLLNEVGASLLMGRTPTLPQPATHVVVQPNFQVFAFEPTGEDAFFLVSSKSTRRNSDSSLVMMISRASTGSASIPRSLR